MPPPPTPTTRPNAQQQGPSQSSSSSPDSLLQSSERVTNEGLTLLDHVQRFANASTGATFPSLNSINLTSDYIYRNLHAESNNMDTTNVPGETNFDSRIRRHYNEMARLQEHLNQLVNAPDRRSQRIPTEHELAINNIPLQLRNISRELRQDENREAYFVETTDEDDQSFQEEDEPDVIYYSEDNGNAVVYLDSNESDLSEEDSEAVRHRIQNNERIILASGRNGGIPYRFSSSILSNSGVPLRRQNAIRESITHKRNSSVVQNRKNEENSEEQSLSKSLDDEAKLLQQEIHSFYEAIISLDEFQGESPLFHKRFHDSDEPFRLLVFADLGTRFRISDSALHLDQKLDAYLQKRRNNQLWLNINHPPPPPLAQSRLKDKKRSKTSRGMASMSAKRQKITHDRNDDIAIYSERIPSRQFLYSKVEKEAIISGLESSLFNSGSVYSVGTDRKSPVNRFKLVLTDVGESINGVFNFTPEASSPLESILLKLHNFSKFICGFNDFSQCLPRSKILVRKLNVLDRISIDKMVCFKKDTKDELNIPVRGNVVDFKKHDLRFLKSNTGELPSSSRFRSNRIILQLSEWMKLHPFIQFKENYFLSFLKKLDTMLTTFGESKLKRSQKPQVLNRIDEFKCNLHALTRNFSFINDQTINKLKLLQTQNEREQSRATYLTLFVDEWETVLAHELSRQITKEDSTTLLNIQLNFILFALEIDLSKFLDSFIDYIFRHCEDCWYLDNYKKVYANILADETKETENNKATLVCSIDRKSGAIEILNTLPFLHHNDKSTRSTNFILSIDQNFTLHSTRTSFVYDDFGLFEGDKVPQNSYAFNTTMNLGSLNNAIVDTKLTGTFEFENSECDMD